MKKKTGIKKEKAVRAAFAAVFVLLAVLCVFAGAGAADGVKTYVAYHVTTGADALTSEDEGVWYRLDHNQVQPNIRAIVYSNNAGGYYFSVVDETDAGLYQKAGGTKIVNVEFPRIEANVVVNGPNDYEYALAGNFVPKKEGYTIVVGNVKPTEDELGEAGATINWQLVNANGAVKIVTPDGNTFNFKDETAGEYALQPYFVDYLVPVAPEIYNYGNPISFTLGKADDERIFLSAEKVNVGEEFTVTVWGLPGVQYKITTTTGAEFSNILNPASVSSDKKTVTFTMPAAGQFDLTVKAVAKNEDVTFNLYKVSGGTSLANASLEIIDGFITADSEYDAYTIGDDIRLFGTSSTTDSLYFYIEGQNVPFTQIKANDGSGPVSTSGGEWEITLRYCDIVSEHSVGHPLDAGTYTLYVSKVNSPTSVKGEVTAGTYVTVPVLLKQSFINLVSVPTVVAQGDNIVITGTANAARSVIWYLIKPGFFEAGVLKPGFLEAGVQKVVADEFTITIDREFTKDMEEGLYSFIVQHPMYDAIYSIAPKGMGGWNSGTSSFAKPAGSAFDGSILKSDRIGIYNSGSSLTVTDAAAYNDAIATPLLDATTIHQAANAAEALCDALDSQNFDDMYATTSFIVEAPTPVSPVSLSVIVMDAENNYISEAEVVVLSENMAPMTLKTTTDGSATFTLYPGEYTVSVTKTGYIAQTKSVSFGSTGYTQEIQLIEEMPSGLTLSPGWNFISVPKNLASSCDTAAELFAGVNTGDNSIFSFDGQIKEWKQVDGSTVISPLNAYWIYSTEMKVLTPVFDTTHPVPAAKNVYTGWNAVGASAENPIAAKSAFTGVNWRTFLLWDAGSQKTSTVYDKDGSGAYSDEQSIPLYKGGWLYMNENGTLAAKTA